MLENLWNALFGPVGGKKVKVQGKTSPTEEMTLTPQYHDPAVQKISEYAGGPLEAGQVVMITLHEILDLIPPANPNRRRKDSYDRLAKILRDEYGVELKIDSGR